MSLTMIWYLKQNLDDEGGSAIVDAEERAKLRAFLVQRKLTGQPLDGRTWNTCLVCGWPTRMAYACQQTQGRDGPHGREASDVTRPDLQAHSPSGRNCWFDGPISVGYFSKPYDFDGTEDAG